MKSKSPSRPGLREIAQAANCSLMTVSRALNNAPRISAATKAKIQEIARKLGYRPDPKLASLMGHLRQSRTKPHTEVFAFIWPDMPMKAIAESFWLSELKEGAEARASSLGIQLHHFFLSEQKVTPNRLDRALYSRGIKGMVIGPLYRRAHGHLSMKWDRYSVMSIGLGLWRPAFHRVHHDHFQGMMRLIRYLRRCGHRRIALSISDEWHRRMFGAWWAAFVAHHPLSPKESAKLIYLDDGKSSEKLLQWWKTARADALIVDSDDVRKKLNTLEAKEVTGATLSWSQRSMGFAGIDQRSSAIGAAAVDATVAIFNRSEMGVPSVSNALLVEGKLIKPS